MKKHKSPITGKIAGSGSKIGSKVGKRIIRRHHTLLKQKKQLEHAAEKDAVVKSELDKINSELQDREGLELYQRASIAGQDPNRGGDSSKLLVEWLDRGEYSKMRVLEVGSLSVDNAIAHSTFCQEIDRIDLNSQHPQIKQQDFMTMPVPERKYGLLSLSLVVNFVPDASQRGEMLRLTTKMLMDDGLLFLVLPAPCVTNSRYMTEDRLGSIMASLGYMQLHGKVTPRIAYWLFKLDHSSANNEHFPKKLVNDGKKRNNFTIVL